MNASPATEIDRDIIRVERDADPVAKRIGLVALATDHTTERDFARLCDPDEIGIYVNRIDYENPTTPESLMKTGPRLQSAAEQILPDEFFDVMVYACTAATVVLGDDRVAHHLNAAKPGSQCVTPTSAAFAAFSALDVKNVSILTPYSPNVTAELASYFSGNNLNVVNAVGLGFEDDRQMARITPASIIAAGEEVSDLDADALFISCTALRALSCAQELEDRIGKPVITSNQAMIWRSLRLAEISRPINGYGRLFNI
jgi:maleate isomerase